MNFQVNDTYLQLFNYNQQQLTFAVSNVSDNLRFNYGNFKAIVFIIRAVKAKEYSNSLILEVLLPAAYTYTDYR